MDLKKVGIGVALLAIAGVVVWAAVTRLGGDEGSDAATNGGTPSATPSASARPSTSPQVFSGTTLEGEQLDLADYAGKPVVVNFWASWCGFCEAEMPELIRFAEQNPDVTVIGVAVNDDETAAREAAEGWGLTFPSVLDPEGRIFSEFQSQGLPTTVFFDADLEVKDTIVGQTDLAGFEAGLEKAR